mmetsp:Transcript_15681/g.26140  ORF Transcript_15681/g.26140 Transcript_15681/m.26140 type:complete len:228 (+) Transcript_15681:49-732(+)
MNQPSRFTRLLERGDALTGPLSVYILPYESHETSFRYLAAEKNQWSYWFCNKLVNGVDGVEIENNPGECVLIGGQDEAEKVGDKAKAEFRQETGLSLDSIVMNITDDESVIYEKYQNNKEQFIIVFVRVPDLDGLAFLINQILNECHNVIATLKTPSILTDDISFPVEDNELKSVACYSADMDPFSSNGDWFSLAIERLRDLSHQQISICDTNEVTEDINTSLLSPL